MAGGEVCLLPPYGRRYNDVTENILALSAPCPRLRVLPGWEVGREEDGKTCLKLLEHLDRLGISGRDAQHAP